MTVHTTDDNAQPIYEERGFELVEWCGTQLDSISTSSMMVQGSDDRPVVISVSEYGG